MMKGMAPTETSPTSLQASFDQLTAQSIHHPVSLKWNTYAAQALPLWIADMDLPISQELLAALEERLHAPLGYTDTGSSKVALKERLAARLAEQGVAGLSGRNIHLMPAVVPGLYAAVAAFTQRGEGVLAFTPTYPPFHMAVQKQGRIWQGVALQYTEETDKPTWQIDWNALEAAVTPQTRLLMLCHPHNPTGRVWTADELSKLADFTERHDLTVCCDELHADLRYPDSPDFRSFASLPQAAQRTVILTGPGKSYNIAGLSAGAIISPNEALVEQIKDCVGGLLGSISAFSLSAWELALMHAGPWLTEVLDYLHGNRELVREWAAGEPLVKFVAPEATYLAWLDLRAHPQAHRIQAYLTEQGVALSDGATFTAPEDAERYQGFVRLNFATSRPVLQEALSRLSTALHESN